MKSNTKSCLKCKEVKDLSEFLIDNGKPRTNCKACGNLIKRQTRTANKLLQKEIAEEKRICIKCNIEKSNGDFHVTTGSSSVFELTCKICTRVIRQQRADDYLKRDKQTIKLPKEIPTSKLCTKCKVVLQISEFGTSNGKPRGDCKRCCNLFKKNKRDAEKLNKTSVPISQNTIVEEISVKLSNLGYESD
jgi:adenine-specific DNA methylase